MRKVTQSPCVGQSPSANLDAVIRRRVEQRNIEGRPLEVTLTRRSLRSDRRRGSSRSSFLGSARLRFYEFSLVLEAMPLRKNRSTSPVLRNISAKYRGAPLL